MLGFSRHTYPSINTNKQLHLRSAKWYTFQPLSWYIIQPLHTVVSRAKIKDYQPVQQGKETYLLTKSKKIIRLSLVKSEKYTDSFLKVESPAKRMKEQGIKNRLVQGYEGQLELIKQSLSKPRGTKKVDKVQQRIGRAKQKYPSITCTTSALTLTLLPKQ